MGSLIPSQTVRFGLDAMLNLFELDLSDMASQLAAFIPAGYDFSTEDFRFRVQDVNIPDLSLGTYTVDYLTRTYEKPSAKITTPTEFTFNFRVDKLYKLYQFMLNWYNSIHNLGSGTVGTLEGKVCNVVVRPVTTLPGSSGGTPTVAPQINGWTFFECFPKTIGGFNFAHAGGEPAIISITLGFMYMECDVSQPTGTTTDTSPTEGVA
jgi:hypothetical protein